MSHDYDNSFLCVEQDLHISCPVEMTNTLFSPEY